MLKQLGSKLAPRLGQSQQLVSLKECSCLHTSSVVNGVGIPERAKSMEDADGTFELLYLA